MSALRAISRKGRFWIVRHKPAKWHPVRWHVIDSATVLPISRIMGGFDTPLKAWRFIQRSTKA